PATDAPAAGVARAIRRPAGPAPVGAGRARDPLAPRPRRSDRRRSRARGRDRETVLRLMDPAEPRPALSFVVPVYNEEGNVGPLHAELTDVARATGRTYELVFVNDGSRDRTLERLIEIAQGDPQLRVVELDG